MHDRVPQTARDAVVSPAAMIAVVLAALVVGQAAAIAANETESLARAS